MSEYLTYSYHRLLGWPGAQAVVAVSDDLVTWDYSQNQIEQVGAPRVLVTGSLKL